MYLQKFDDPLSKSDEANRQMANLPLPKSRSDFPDVATEMEEPFKVGTAHSMSLLSVRLSALLGAENAHIRKS